MSSSWEPPQQPSVEGLPAYQPAPGMPAPPPPPPGMAPPAPPASAMSSQGSPAPIYAGWGARVGATLLDAVFQTLLFLLAMVPIVAVAYLVVGDDGEDLSDVAAGIGTAVLLITLIAITFLYAPVTMRRSGQTPGKKIVGIRVVRDNGAAMTFRYAVLREAAVKGALIGWVGGTFFLPTLLNYLWPLWDESNRAIHDMIVSSHVVIANTEQPPRTPPPPGPSAWGP